jgi:hypothetical protein
MAQRFKGPRRQIRLGSVSCKARRGLAARAAHHGIAFSQYVSDLLAIAVGMPELARELNQATLDFAETAPGADNIEPPQWGTPRVPLPVYDVICQISATRGINAADFVAEVCDAHIEGRPLPAVDTEGEEALLLTTA